MKTKMQYRTSPMTNLRSGQTSATKRRPHIVNVRMYNEDELVRFALDNNYIEGAKYELAKGIVKGVVEAERALISAGNAVRIDGWMKYEPRLKGSVDAEKRTLSKSNTLIIGIRALKEMKLSLDSFSWQCVDEGGAADTPTGNAPTITGAGTRGDDPGEVNVAGATLDVTGENLEGATQIELLDDTGALWQTLNATYSDGKLTAGVDFGSQPSQYGTLRVTTSGGTATFPIRYAAH